MARRNLGAHSARRLAGGHLALAVAALRHEPTSARARVNPWVDDRNRPEGLTRPAPVNDRLRREAAAADNWLAVEAQIRSLRSNLLRLGMQPSLTLYWL